jgi:hypothetical protein
MINDHAENRNVGNTRENVRNFDANLNKSGFRSECWDYKLQFPIPGLNPGSQDPGSLTSLKIMFEMSYVQWTRFAFHFKFNCSRFKPLSKYENEFASSASPPPPGK